MQREQLLALGHLVSRLGKNLNTGSGLHRIILTSTSRAQAPGTNAESQCIQLGQVTIGLCNHVVRVRRHRQRGIRIAALSADHLLPRIHCAAVLQSLLHVGIVHTSQLQHVSGQLTGQLHDICGATTCENFHRFADLEGIADGQA